jgi:hypothetical protein
MTALQFILLAFTGTIGLIALGTLLAIAATAATAATSGLAISLSPQWRSATGR